MASPMLSRLGAGAGVLSAVVTFVGFGVHGGLPNDTTPAAIRAYVDSVSAGQAGLGNFLELLGYVLFLVFAAFLYALARTSTTDRLDWLPVLGLVAATAYVAVSATLIGTQLAVVDWAKAGGDPRSVGGLYAVDSAAFPLSFELAAAFLAATGAALLRAGRWRLLAAASCAAGAVVLIGGLIGAISPSSNLEQVGFLLFVVWQLGAGIYFVARPPTA